MNQKPLKFGLILAAASLFMSVSAFGSQGQKPQKDPRDMGKEKRIRITKVWALSQDQTQRAPAGANPWVAERFVPGAQPLSSDEIRGRYMKRVGPLTFVKDHSRRNLEIKDEDKTWGRDGFLFSSPWW